MTRPCGCPLDIGRTMIPQRGVSANVCTCCGSFEVCAELPVGSGRIYNCAACLNPRSKGDRQAIMHEPKGRTFEKTREIRLPKTLRKLIESDISQIRNDAASAQRQKYAQDAREVYDR